MTAGTKYTLWTVLFYVLFLSLIPLAEHAAPIGPCVPGGGILLFLLAPVLSGLGLLVCFIVLAKGHHSILGALLVNAVVLMVSLVLFNWP
jgi:hypothetical protein